MPTREEYKKQNDLVNDKELHNAEKTQEKMNQKQSQEQDNQMRPSYVPYHKHHHILATLFVIICIIIGGFWYTNNKQSQNANAQKPRTEVTKNDNRKISYNTPAKSNDNKSNNDAANQTNKKIQNLSNKINQLKSKSNINGAATDYIQQQPLNKKAQLIQTLQKYPILQYWYALNDKI